MGVHRLPQFFEDIFRSERVDAIRTVLILAAEFTAHCVRFSAASLNENIFEDIEEYEIFTCPYAKHVARVPLKIDSTSGLAVYSYTFLLSSSSSKT